MLIFVLFERTIRRVDFSGFLECFSVFFVFVLVYPFFLTLSQCCFSYSVGLLGFIQVLFRATVRAIFPVVPATLPRILCCLYYTWQTKWLIDWLIDNFRTYRNYCKTRSSSLAEGQVLSAGSRSIMHTEKHKKTRVTLKFNAIVKVVETHVREKFQAKCSGSWVINSELDFGQL